MAAKRCSSSREGKVLLFCWFSPELRPHGRTPKGMDDMIASDLAAHQER
jgi:hypothetical protein